MERILIIGNTGAGKSTFAKALAQKTGLPLVHLDKLYWHGNWEHLSREEFDAVLETELIKPRWIIDGNFSRTFPHRLQYADTVFYLDIPTLTCLWGLTKRVFANYGKTRDDMGGNCPEYFDKQKPALYKGAIAYNRRNRKKYYELLAASHKQVIIFRSRRQIKKFLESL